MTELKVTLDPVALREATSQVIMGMLTPELRAELLSKAIQALLNPSTNSWERGKSPIEIAFNDAVQQTARACALDVVKGTPEVMDKLRSLAKSTAERVLATDADKMAERMAEAFVGSMRRD